MGQPLVGERVITMDLLQQQSVSATANEVPNSRLHCAHAGKSGFGASMAAGGAAGLAPALAFFLPCPVRSGRLCTTRHAGRAGPVGAGSGGGGPAAAAGGSGGGPCWWCVHG